MMDFIENMEGKAARTRSEVWDIQVNSAFQGNTVEYKPNHHVVIRANSIEFALSLISRGRELIEKYPPHG